MGGDFQARLASSASAGGMLPMVPAVVRVLNRHRETHDTFTLTIEPPNGVSSSVYTFRPGQFNMLYAFGVGEVPISVSGNQARPDILEHTIRAVGSVTTTLVRLRRGSVIGVRGPFGTAWPVDVAEGYDVVIVAGGIGLAPLRPVLYHLINNRGKFGRIALLYGTRTPADLLYLRELEKWRSRFDIQVLVTVDHSDVSWHGHVGVVSSLFSQAAFDAENTIGLMCGPEIMMRYALREFESRSVSDNRLYVSLERNMQCAVGFCGHCQFGPKFICMDGPVFRYDQIRLFSSVREA